MTRKRGKPEGPSELRLRAEEELRLKGGEKLAPRTDDETRRLLHELQVHQVELELQNEELRRAREELEDALERYTDLYDFAPVGYLTIDRDGVIRTANITCARLLGIYRSTLIGQRFINFIDIHDLPFFSYFLRKVSTGNANDSCELKLKGGGNSPVFIRVEAVASPYTGDCRLAIIDITDRREADEKLLKSKQRLDEAQGVTHVGSWEWDSIADEISVSDEFNRIFGRVLTIYESFIDMVHPDDRDTVNRAVRETLTNQKPYNVHYRIVRPDGAIRVIHALGKAVTDDAGKSLGMIGTVQDVTERRELVEKLETLNAELAVRAEALAEANIDLEAFNHSVAHDLRIPLNIISGYCQLVQRMCGEKLDEECQGYLREVFKTTMQMDCLIDTLLRFSSVNRAELKHEKIDLSIMARKTAMELNMSQPERHVAFHIAKGITANGDANLLRIVIDNLIGNAWKYSSVKENGVIEFGVNEMAGSQAYFVRDNGTGFDMAYAEKLFVPFHRLLGSGEIKGHGIGLATVERIIRRHGGRIWAKSEPGKGATFYFTLSAN
jgi:PAS domain S-box-containing protein